MQQLALSAHNKKVLVSDLVYLHVLLMTMWVSLKCSGFLPLLATLNWYECECDWLFVSLYACARDPILPMVYPDSHLKSAGNTVTRSRVDW